MRNYITSGGLLDDSDEHRSASLLRSQETNTAFESMLPFKPVDDKERRMMERTMIPNPDGTFTVPEREIYNQNKVRLQAAEAKATHDLEKKLNNPFFKIADFATDLVRNTVAAPLNFLTDGVAFQSDPSKTAVSGYKSRISELSELQTANLAYFSDGRDKRATAFSEAITNRSSNKASGTPRLNSEGAWVQVYEDGSSVPVTDPAGNVVKTLDNSKIHMVAGVPHKYNPVTQTLEPTIGAEEAFKLVQQQAESKQYGAARQKYLGERPQAVAMMASETNRIENQMKITLNGARRFISELKATGWNGVMSAIPESDAKVLGNYLLTIKANVGFQALSEMRANSMTGGALGNVSEIELKQLNAVLGSLDQMSTSAQLLETLDTIDQKSKSIMSIMQNKMMELDQHYKYEKPAPDPTVLNNGAPTIDPQDPDQAQSQAPPVHSELDDMDKVFGFGGSE